MSATTLDEVRYWQSYAFLELTVQPKYVYEAPWGPILVQRAFWEKMTSIQVSVTSPPLKRMHYHHGYLLQRNSCMDPRIQRLERLLNPGPIA